MRGKPAGSRVRLPRFKWHGEGAPFLGCYMVSGGGSGYEVIGIEETLRSGPEHDPRIFNLLCEKIEPSDIPGEAQVVSLYWEPRGRRAA